MSLSDTLKDKKKIIILVVVVAVLAAVLVITFIPFGSEKPVPGPQVISQKAKITLSDETAKPTATTAPPAKPTATAKTDVKPAVEKPVPPSPEKLKPVVRAEAVPTSTPQPRPPKAAKTDVKPSKTVKTAKYTGKSWVVNAASFTTKDEAKGLAKALKLAGYKSYVTEFTKDDTQWYRVRAGFFSTQSDAEKAAEKIKTQFKIDTPWVVRPAKKELSKYARP
ncbi:MAG: SPOR domain-containing protein [Deltaproteobacteria bacterium]